MIRRAFPQNPGMRGKSRRQQTCTCTSVAVTAWKSYSLGYEIVRLIGSNPNCLSELFISTPNFFSRGDGDVAQLVEYRTGTLPTQVRFPGEARDFLPGSTFSADSLTVSGNPRVQSHAFTSLRTLKMPWSMSEFGG